MFRVKPREENNLLRDTFPPMDRRGRSFVFFDSEEFGKIILNSRNKIRGEICYNWGLDPEAQAEKLRFEFGHMRSFVFSKIIILSITKLVYL
jgi:hypothetical protein